MEPAISSKFYRAVIQAVILFVAETWVLLDPMEQRIEGVCVGFLRQVTKLKGKRLNDGLWRKVSANKVLQEVGKQPLQICLDRRHAIVTEWVALQPIFDVCVRDMGYEGGGKLQVAWLRHESAEKQPKVTAEDILAAEREQWRQESYRRGERKGGTEGEGTDSDG